MEKTALRIIDANLNRAREGLRVCEEIMRFALNDGKLAGRFKIIRHEISDFIKKSGFDHLDMLKQRDAANDIGKNINTVNKTHEKIEDLFLANIQRSKEALRVLEEFSKTYEIGPLDYFQNIRFEVYELEKEAFNKLRSLCNY